MLKLHKDLKSNGANSQQVCQPMATICRIMISGSEGAETENCWRLGVYFWEVSLYACLALVLI